MNKPTPKDFKLLNCSMCRTSTISMDPAGILPGMPCTNKACSSYLVVIVGGKHDGRLVWHHPQECEEDSDPCKPCGIYRPAAQA